MKTKMEIECVYQAVGDLLNSHRSVICCNAAEKLLCVSSYNREKRVLTCKRKVSFHLFSCTPDVIMIVIIMIINGNIID